MMHCVMIWTNEWQLRKRTRVYAKMVSRTQKKNNDYMRWICWGGLKKKDKKKMDDVLKKKMPEVPTVQACFSQEHSI